MSQERPRTPPPAYGTYNETSSTAATVGDQSRGGQTHSSAALEGGAAGVASGETASDRNPPAYADGGYPEEPPPSYYSLYGHVKDMRNDSTGPVDFLRNLAVFLLGTLACTVCLGIALAVPITMIVIGSLYLHQCPAERYIPIYLIVGGSVAVFKSLLNICHRKRSSEAGDGADTNIRPSPLDGLFNCFILAWFIAGNVWVYRIYQPDTEHADSEKYCAPTLYWFAYWFLNCIYILMSVMCCCICCAGIYGWKAPSAENERG